MEKSFVSRKPLYLYGAKHRKMSNLKTYFNQESVKDRFSEMLGKRASQFITTVLQIANSNEQLKSADPATLYSAAITAAALDLPVNPNLGFAYIVPYKGNAAFQLGYKGFVQLALRSGLFETINVTDVKEGEIVNFDRLTGEITYHWTMEDRDLKKTIGYAAYFELLTGFKKSLYMSVPELERHGKSFSQTYKKGFGMWKDNFDAMAKKTVLKLLLSRYAPLTIEMQTAQIADQSIIKDPETLEVNYYDNTPEKLTLEEIEELYANKAQLLAKEEDEAISRIIAQKQEGSYMRAKQILEAK